MTLLKFQVGQVINKLVLLRFQFREIGVNLA
jgi:hypothetical protein